MKRDIDLKDISDGRLYSAGDMARTDCRGCQGCSACCRGMGDTVVLDPMDVWRLNTGTGMDFTALINGGYIELGIADGMILPHLKMNGEDEACSFLDESGRCTVHIYRPGICRMFPMGRYYSENGIRYFLQIYECRMNDRSKIKVKKWIGIPNLKAYEAYIWDWHQFLLKCEEGLGELDENNTATLTLYVLRTFYESFWREKEETGFYSEFYQRLESVKEKLGF